jgi:two-component sensor histidine kinase
LVTNAVKHALTPEEAFLIGRDPKSIGWVLLEMVNFTHEMASIRVTDPGHPTKAPRFRYQQKAGGDTLSEITMNGIKVDKPKIPSESGRGLALVRRISGHHCGSYPETETGHRVVWAFLSWKHVQSITWDIPDEDMLYLLAI